MSKLPTTSTIVIKLHQQVPVELADGKEEVGSLMVELADGREGWRERTWVCELSETGGFSRQRTKIAFRAIMSWQQLP